MDIITEKKRQKRRAVGSKSEWFEKVLKKMKHPCKMGYVLPVGEFSYRSFAVFSRCEEGEERSATHQRGGEI
jgi:hypothetical protein